MLPSTKRNSLRLITSRLFRAFLQQRTQRFLQHQYANHPPTSISLAFWRRQSDGCVTRNHRAKEK
jgi:hypothetical protein